MVAIERRVSGDDLATVFRALGDPTRLAIFELIRAAGPEAHEGSDVRSTVSAIARNFDVSLSTVSHHLKELRRARLIRCERRGQQILCSVDPAALDLVERFLGASGSSAALPATADAAAPAPTPRRPRSPRPRPASSAAP